MTTKQQESSLMSAMAGCTVYKHDGGHFGDYALTAKRYNQLWHRIWRKEGQKHHQAIRGRYDQHTL